VITAVSRFSGLVIKRYASYEQEPVAVKQPAGQEEVVEPGGEVGSGFRPKLQDSEESRSGPQQQSSADRGVRRGDEDRVRAHTVM